jgi:GrpB-like predicted nucleotidyltransferase (UPF0157 family)
MPVDVVDYDPAWQQEFTEQRDRLTILLHGWLAEPIEHVGSTAVPGLASKRVVDRTNLFTDRSVVVSPSPTDRTGAWW